MDVLWQFVALLAAHWVGDFVCQTHWQASNKSKNLDALTRHVAGYTLVLLVATAIIFYGTHPNTLALFVLINSIAHWLTDFVTSRWSSKLFGKDWHNFFVVVGFDQLIHQVTLAATMWLLIVR